MDTVCLQMVPHTLVSYAGRLTTVALYWYKGQFHRGEFYGQGLYQSPDGLMYEGDWEYNIREGQLHSIHCNTNDFSHLTI